MNEFKKITEYILSIPSLKQWPELKEMISKSAENEIEDWLLPIVACKCFSNLSGNAIPGSAAVACLQIGIILIDDMLDSDPRGKHNSFGMPLTSDMASAFQSLGIEAINISMASDQIKNAASLALNQMMFSTAVGQYMDIQNPTTEEDYWKVVETKSSPFFGASLQIGALFGGASIQTAQELNEIGRLYGEMIQIHDDLSDCMEVPANPDWVENRSPLPILFAQTVAHPEKNAFLALRSQISSPNKLKEAQNILIRSGAVSYCVHELLKRYHNAQNKIQKIHLPNKSPIQELFQNLITPLQTLFKSAGINDLGNVMFESIG